MALKFRVKREITRELIRLATNEENFLRFDGAIYRAKEVPNQDKQPPWLAYVTHLESGAKGEIIVPAVLKSEIEDAYPDEGYIGLSFLIVNKGKKAGKEYNTFLITEIETDGEYVEEVEDTATEAAAPVEETTKKGKRKAS